MDYEPIFYLTQAEAEKETNYLQVIYKVDKMNAEKLKQKKEYLNKKGDWKNPDFQKIAAKEEVITLSDLAKEGLKLMQAKKEKKAEEDAEAEEYRAKLRNIYKFRQFKDDPKIEKLIEHAKATMDLRELDKYNRLVPTTAKRGQQKKLKLRLEAKQQDLDKSFNDEENSVNSNRSLKSAGAVEMDVEDDEFKYYMAGMHEIVNDMTISALIANEQIKHTLEKEGKGKQNIQSNSPPKNGNEGKIAQAIDAVKEVPASHPGRQAKPDHHCEDDRGVQRDLQHGFRGAEQQAI